ncbi:rifin [Plasmodium falciparum Dd2]|uniref:Rifin n=2 Tax=Plasmodium falciparum TaxID=5833 RepID=A0A0L7LXU2_PLAF4|nr:rifin [Plasmodium falciparum Dd2]
MLLFTFLINTLLLPHYEKCRNNNYNISLIQNNIQGTTIQSRLLAQTKNHNPHYHNDPELKEIIDKMNEEAIKKYQQTHDTYKQLKDVVEKNGTKYTGGNDTEPMSTLEKELLETYEEMFGDESNTLKSGMHPNEDGGSDKPSTCECTDINNIDLTERKGKDKYLKNLKHRCIGGICSCSVASAFLTMLGFAFAKTAALGAVASHEAFKSCLSSISIFSLLDRSTMLSALQAGTAVCAGGANDMAGTISTFAMGAFYPYGIAALVLILIVVVLIILYIWLYRRRKNSWKHECKKHLCK